MIRKLLIASIISGVIVLSFFQFYQYLKTRIVTSDLKKVTERRISAFLKAPVEVDQITVGLLKHISLSGLKIQQTQKGFPLLIGVKKIIVRYDLLSFLKRNFKIPTEIFLEAPYLTLKAFQSPETIFETNILKSDHGILTRFEFEDGEIRVPWFGSEENFSLVGIEGKATPKKGDLFDVRFKAHLSGFLNGILLAYGEVNPTDKTYHLEMNLDQVSASKNSQIPISNLKGSLEFEHDVIRIHQINFLLRGIPCELSGDIQHIFSPKPIFNLSVRIKEGTAAFNVKLDADFGKETFSTLIEYLDQKYEFSGSLQGLPIHFKIPTFTLNQIYHGSGEFNSKKNAYWMEIDYDNQRFKLDFSFKGLFAKLQVKLDHFNISGFDLVTFATIYLKPFEEEWKKGNHIFDAQIQTDYLIFHYQPLRDFKGTAKLSLQGIHDLTANWGNVSRLTGEIQFGKVPETNLHLLLGPISVEEFEYLGTHPLPVSLAGKLNGKMDVRGPLNNVDLNGAFTISDGRIGSLHYDNAVINFGGHLPYLMLKDSKILKGKNTFGLKGGFDFSLKNFMKGIQIDNSEHVIIWRGLELSSELEDTQKVRMGLQTLGRIQAEYQFGNRTSLHMTAEEDQTKKEYLSVGPKLKF